MQALDGIAELSSEVNSDEMMAHISMEKVKIPYFGIVTKKVRSISTDKELDKLYELKSVNETNKEEIDKQIRNEKIAKIGILFAELETFSGGWGWVAGPRENKA